MNNPPWFSGRVSKGRKFHKMNLYRLLCRFLYQKLSCPQNVLNAARCCCTCRTSNDTSSFRIPGSKQQHFMVAGSPLSDDQAVFGLIQFSIQFSFICIASITIQKIVSRRFSETQIFISHSGRKKRTLSQTVARFSLGPSLKQFGHFKKMAFIQYS